MILKMAVVVKSSIFWYVVPCIIIIIIILLGRAVAQRLDAGFPPRRPGFAYG
jgi:hypothetical protein